ncbi:MAG: hypothetical protein OEW15_15120 [Nitrospirota bacterium]|nr:hypothetical protein [Nitrospirota bacterium]
MHALNPDSGRTAVPTASCAIMLLIRATTIAVFLLSSPAAARQNGTIDIGAGEKDWRTEFDDICSLVDTAMEMSPAELEELLFRCQALEPRIEKLPETPKKVFGRKLRMCRDLYRFVLDNKYGKNSADGSGAGVHGEAGTKGKAVGK